MSYNPFTLEGKTILVTGASSGIGRATSVECSKQGATLIITGRNEARLIETFKLLYGTGHYKHVADLTDQVSLEKLVETIPLLDGCVNNAGINKSLPVQFINLAELSETLNTNTISPIILTQLLVKKKKLKKGASLVFTSSIAGVFRSSMANSMYSASKGAINGFMKNAAFELAVKGIRVNSVNPGMVSTGIIGKGAITEEQYLEDMKKYPLQRYGTPEEVAYAIIYLLSDASSWVTGTSLLIDGGITLR
ncbi:MAG: 3-oxoacyl-ACP reductase [Odoribacter sp.]|nr:3-oxoacyl-ACP reductase [Odoribacter sp.]